MNNDVILEAKNVRKSFSIGKRQLDVLQGVHLDVFRGEFVSLQGASGAGKSTLLQLMGGLDRPDDGNILFDGKRLREFSDMALTHWRNEKVGFIFQSYYLLPELDALENVCIPAKIARIPYSRMMERAKHLLERVGLKDRIEHRPTELSGGEQQRVAIARALMNEPVLLFADEPTGNLDSHTGKEIMDLLLSLRGTCSLVMATHDGAIASLADRSFRLVDGRIIL